MLGLGLSATQGSILQEVVRGASVYAQRIGASEGHDVELAG